MHICIALFSTVLDVPTPPKCLNALNNMKNGSADDLPSDHSSDSQTYDSLFNDDEA